MKYITLLEEYIRNNELLPKNLRFKIGDSVYLNNKDDVYYSKEFKIISYDFKRKHWHLASPLKDTVILEVKDKDLLTEMEYMNGTIKNIFEIEKHNTANFNNLIKNNNIYMGRVEITQKDIDDLESKQMAKKYNIG